MGQRPGKGLALNADVDRGQDGEGIVTRGTLVIDVESCKGCDLCIDACPPRVLVMTTSTLNTRGYRYPVLLPGCTGCRACSQICPDFVFAVYKYDQPIRWPLLAAEEVPG